MSAHSIAECADHIAWSVLHSPTAYAESRDTLRTLYQALRKAESKYLTEKEPSQ